MFGRKPTGDGGRWINKIAGDREVADATERGLFGVRWPGRFAACDCCCGIIRVRPIDERYSCNPILAAVVDLTDQSGSEDVI